MSAEERARARWAGAPGFCQVTDPQRGLVCTRTVSRIGGKGVSKHPGKHHDPTSGYWSEHVKPEPRRQFCDLDWEPPKPDAAQFYASYEVGRDSLFTVGTVGGVYCTKENYRSFTMNLRKWADMIDKYMETYDG